MRNDKLLISVFLGAVSTLPCEIVSHLLVYMGIAKYSIFQLASLLITINRPDLIIGLIVDLTVGGTLACIFYYALKRLGSAFPVIKVILGSLLACLACELVFTATIEGRFFDLRPIGDYYNNIICAVIYGAVLGLLFKKFLFKKPAA